MGAEKIQYLVTQVFILSLPTETTEIFQKPCQAAEMSLKYMTDDDILKKISPSMPTSGNPYVLHLTVKKDLVIGF